MKPLICFVRLILVLFVLLFSPAEAADKQSSRLNTYTLTQQYKLLGAVKVVAGKDCLKFECRSLGVTFLYRPATDEVVMFSDENKTIFRTSGSTPKRPFFAKTLEVAGFDFADAEMQPAEKRYAQIAEHRAAATCTTMAFEHKMLTRINKMQFKTRAAVRVRFYYFDDLPVDKRFGKFVSALMAIPEGPGLPARVLCVTPEGNLVSYLNTSSVQTLRVAQSEFAPPQGYKTVASAQEVLGSHSSGDALDWIQK